MTAAPRRVRPRADAVVTVHVDRMDHRGGCAYAVNFPHGQKITGWHAGNREATEHYVGRLVAKWRERGEFSEGKIRQVRKQQLK